MQLDILYKAESQIKKEDLLLLANKDSTAITLLTSDLISTEIEIGCGFCMIELSSAHALQINDVKINGESIRELIYLSFLLENGKRLQPRTDITGSHHVWCMPIIYPLSAFFSFVQNILPHHYLGKNLFDHYDFYFPESVRISGKNPRLMQDYFFYDSHFSIVEKKDIKTWNEDVKLPFLQVNFDFDEKNCLEEIISNKKKLDFENHVPMQSKQNEIKYGLTKRWKTSYFIQNSKDIDIDLLTNWRQRSTLDFTQWPFLYKLLEQVPAENIVNAYVAELPSGSFITPHKDTKKGKYYKEHCNAVLYLPLSCPEGVYFKFANFGLVNLLGNSIVNNANYSHAVVNDSTHDRFIISLTLLNPSEKIFSVPTCINK